VAQLRITTRDVVPFGHRVTITGPSISANVCEGSSMMAAVDDGERSENEAPSMGAYCHRCGRALPSDAAYCPDCGTQRAITSSETTNSGRDWQDQTKSGRDWSDHSKSGGDWIDSGGGDVFLVDNMTADSGQVPTRTWRSAQRRLPVSEPPAWTAALGVVGSVASGLALAQGALPYGVGVVAAVIFAMLFVWWAVFAQLRKEGFVSLGLFKSWSAKRALESDGMGGIYLTKIAAQCPFCPTTSQMDLVNDEERHPWLICRRNPRLHRLMFDHTQVPAIDPD
jgi:hypothetical protein